jgi:hypothetical protein
MDNEEYDWLNREDGYNTIGELNVAQRQVRHALDAVKKVEDALSDATKALASIKQDLKEELQPLLNDSIEGLREAAKAENKEF